MSNHKGKLSDRMILGMQRLTSPLAEPPMFHYGQENHIQGSSDKNGLVWRAKTGWAHFYKGRVYQAVCEVNPRFPGRKLVVDWIKTPYPATVYSPVSRWKYNFERCLDVLWS